MIISFVNVFIIPIIAVSPLKQEQKNGIEMYFGLFLEWCIAIVQNIVLTTILIYSMKTIFHCVINDESYDYTLFALLSVLIQYYFKVGKMKLKKCSSLLRQRILKVLIHALKVVVIILLSWIIGWLVLTLVYSIPVTKIKENVRKSVDIFQTEKTYYAPAGNALDNWTDSVMLLTAAHENTQNSFVASLYNFCDYISGEVTPDEALVSIYSNNSLEVGGWNYERYWHGYLLFVKPLLYFMSYSQIRAVISMCVLLLFVMVVVCCTRQNFTYLILGFVAAFIFMNPTSIMSSIQYSTVWMITLASCIILLKIYNSRFGRFKKYAALVMLLTGILVNFFDLFTYPLVSLGIPLIIIMALISEDKLGNCIFMMSYVSAAWLCGYIGMWVGKWTIATIVLKENVFNDAYSQMLFRSNGNEGFSVTLREVIAEQFIYIDRPDIIIIIFLASVVSAIKLISIGGRIYTKKITFVISAVLVSIYPIIWFAFVKQHSMMHAWMTFRIFAVSVFSLASILGKSILKQDT